MKRNTSFGLTAIAATTVLWLAAPTAAQAGEQQGVRCPSGSTADIGSNNRTLKCAKVETINRDAMCVGITVSNQGDVKQNLRLEHVTAGRDVCKVPGGTATSPVTFLPLPGDPPASSFTQVEQAGKDVFRATKNVYVFPERGPIYNPLHNASLGVACPAGYDGDPVFDGKGIRCDKRDGSPKTADCDFGFTREPDQRGNEDRCLGLHNGPTKPRGMTKIQHDLERDSDRISWYLNENVGQDTWQRKVYAFPNSR
ncbi:MAG: hypothetical protein AD742_10955 [Methylibium sp. NZG]|nr:MAG: hypothetical protein AD742_10955 [Methylibium sp. NZG]